MMGLEDDPLSSNSVQEKASHMKKLMSIMLGLALITGVATVSFGQESEKKEDGKKKKGKKKKAEGEEKKPGR